MRVHVLADMEGVAGICRWAQVSHDGALYQEGRRLYTQAINAALRREIKAGAVEVIGMHAKAGTPDGVLSHTVFARDWQDLRFNGVSVGETGINAALCGHFNTPVVLVSGDRATC